MTPPRWPCHVHRQGALLAASAKLEFQALEAEMHKVQATLEEKIDAISSRNLAVDAAYHGGDAPVVAKPRLVDRAGVGDAKGDPAKAAEEVRVYGGFNEVAVRLVFPYAENFGSSADSHKVYHMTILKDGVIENPKKRLYTGGVFTVNRPPRTFLEASLKLAGTPSLKLP